MKDIDDAVLKLQQKYIAAVSERNVKALIQLYDHKVRIFDAWDVWEYGGADAWQIAIEGWLSSHPADKLKVSFSDSTILGNIELATMTAIVTYAGISPDGTESHSMQNRITWIARTTEHSLRIIHEHTSAPIGFTDMKALLKR